MTRLARVRRAGPSASAKATADRRSSKSEGWFGPAAALLVWLAGFGTSVLAHHSFDAEFDSNKPITITGVVTKLDWVNPHAYVYLDTKTAGGEVKRYKIEMGPPYALVRGGWKRDTLKIGDTVTVEGAASAKDGSDYAGSMPTTQMRLASGQKLTMR